MLAKENPYPEKYNLILWWKAKEKWIDNMQRPDKIKNQDSKQDLRKNREALLRLDPIFNISFLSGFSFTNIYD